MVLQRLELKAFQSISQVLHNRHRNIIYYYKIEDYAYEYGCINSKNMIRKLNTVTY